MPPSPLRPSLLRPKGGIGLRCSSQKALAFPRLFLRRLEALGFQDHYRMALGIPGFGSVSGVSGD